MVLWQITKIEQLKTTNTISVVFWVLVGGWLATPMARESSQAWNQTCATAVTRATAVIAPDPSAAQDNSYLRFYVTWNLGVKKNWLIKRKGVSVMAQWKWIWLVSMRTQVQSLPSLSGLSLALAVSCGVGHRPSLDLVWLRVWCSLAAAASIRPQAWEPPYATGVA